MPESPISSAHSCSSSSAHPICRVELMSIGRRRPQLPRLLVTVALPARLTARVKQVVGEATEVRAVSTMLGAVDAVRATLGCCLLITVPGETELDRVGAYARFRVLYPHVPVIALFVQGSSAHRGTMTIGRVGVTDIVPVDGELDAAVLQVALVRAHAAGVSHFVWDECRPALPEELTTLLKTTLRIAHRPISVSTLASAAGMPERSLRRWCEDARIPSPQWIIGWARLLVAGYYLDDPGRTILQVAELLEFTSSCALRNQLRRYSGLSPRELRARGSTMLLCRALEKAIQHHRDHLLDGPTPLSLRLVR